MPKYLRQVGDQLEVTAAGRRYLSEIVTSTEGGVYAFTDQAPRLLVGAAMARLSRSQLDLRLNWLQEFAGDPSQAAGLVHRVVTEYGDDSVQQLVVVPLVVERPSLLLTKALEWGRLMAYLEQSTRYIYYDLPDAEGRFQYFRPTHLSRRALARYERTLDQIFTLYSEMVRGITEHVQRKYPEGWEGLTGIRWRGATRAQACDAVRPTLPAATRSTVGMVGSTQAIQSLILHLMAHPLPEMQSCGRQIYAETRRVVPAFLERVEMPERGGAQVAYWMETQSRMRELAERFGFRQTMMTDPVTLLDYWPRDELELVARMLFASSRMPLDKIRLAVATWPLERRLEVFNAYMGDRLNRRHKPGRAVEVAHFDWQILGDYGTFRDLQRHRMVDAWEWQDLTVAYGYDVPELVIETGYEATFRRCFELAEGFYYWMVGQGHEQEAQYVTLLGHKLPYVFMENAREAFHLHELRTGPDGHPGYRRIVLEMHRLLTEVYPNLGAAIKFVNKGEDPTLTRMGGEQRTARKMAELLGQE